MSRIKEVEIAGVKYPLNFSVKAASEIAKRYGELENIDKAFNDLSETIWLLSLLIEQGVAFKKINGEKVDGISEDELNIIISFYEAVAIKEIIMEAISGGAKREVETAPNAKTKQGK